MPKLSPQLATQVDEAAESSGFTPMEEAAYQARLTEVQAKNSSNNNPMWVWIYEIIGLADGTRKYRGRKQWDNTTLTEAAMWRVGKTFEAYGVPTDTDTDELIGCTVTLHIAQRQIQAGSRAGQMGNNVERIEPDRLPTAVYHKSSTLRAGAGASGGSDSGPQDAPTRTPQDVPPDRF